MSNPTWKTEPDKHDYPAAAAYLSLIATPEQVNDLITQLKTAPLSHHKAKDILRASGLRLLPRDNPHVAADLAKVHNNKALSPVLLIRGNLTHPTPLHIDRGVTSRPAILWLGTQTTRSTKPASTVPRGSGRTGHRKRDRIVSGTGGEVEGPKVTGLVGVNTAV